MKVAEIRTLVRQNKEWCAQEARSLPTPILEKMAAEVLPSGTLPNESDPHTFSERELIIIRELVFDAEAVHQRVLSAMLVMSYEKQVARRRTSFTQC